MKKIALFVFNGDPMCFIHVLLNALDMNSRGDGARVVMEGAAAALPPELEKADHPLHGLWKKIRAAGLLAGVCEACARKLGSLQAVKDLDLPILNDMSGHPGMAGFRERGFEIITF